MADPAPKTFATVFPTKEEGPVDPHLVAAVRATEKALGMRVFCMVEANNDPEASVFTPVLFRAMQRTITAQKAGAPVAVLLHSRGGDAHTAFRLAKTLIKHSGDYAVIVPFRAKSAATLFSLGASKIILGESGELGPIDVQVTDPEREQYMSALEVVQSLERLSSEAMQIVDGMMALLLNRSGKRIDSLLPAVLKYASQLTRPLFDKIDPVFFTSHARLLKIGEDYARILLRQKYDTAADQIALSLTRKYPDHGFVLDNDELEDIGLETEPVPDNLREPLGLPLLSHFGASTVGFLEAEN